MTTLQSIGLPQSNYVWATRIACAEKGVPHEHIPAYPYSSDIDGIHPLGKIPVMRHGDFTLCESRAICGYIDRAFDGPELIPTSLRDAAVADGRRLSSRRSSRLRSGSICSATCFPRRRTAPRTAPASMPHFRRRRLACTSSPKPSTLVIWAASRSALPTRS